MVYLKNVDFGDEIPYSRIVAFGEMKLRELHAQRIPSRILTLMKRNVIESRFLRQHKLILHFLKC